MHRITSLVVAISLFGCGEVAVELEGGQTSSTSNLVKVVPYCPPYYQYVINYNSQIHDKCVYGGYGDVQDPICDYPYILFTVYASDLKDECHATSIGLAVSNVHTGGSLSITCGNISAALTSDGTTAVICPCNDAMSAHCTPGIGNAIQSLSGTGDLFEDYDNWCNQSSGYCGYRTWSGIDGDISCTFSDVPYCGDGTVNGGEDCDDGNTIGGDGCSSNCQDEGECYDWVNHIWMGIVCVDSAICGSNCQSQYCNCRW